MKRAALYCRVSTEEQAKHGLSVQNQLETLRKFANDNEYKIVGEYLDEGISGQKGYKKRPALKKLISDLDDIDTILFIRLDRWFRSVQHYYEVQAILDEHKVTWNAILEDYETETSAGIFKVNIMLSVAQAEAQRTSEKIKDVFENKKSKGEVCSGSVPLGLKIVDKRVVKDEETAPIIQDYFNTFIEMRSRGALCKYALEKYGKGYSSYGMRYILANERYVEHGVIDSAVFDVVQEILAKRSVRGAGSPTKAPNEIYLFTGLCVCKECGTSLRALKGKGCITYMCGRHNRLGNAGCDNAKGISEKRLEKWLKNGIPGAVREHNINCHPTNTNAVKLDINKLKSKAKRLQDLYINELIEIEDYKEKYAAIQEQIKEAEYASKELHPLDYELTNSILDMYDSLSRENKRIFWNKMIRQISMDKDGEIEFEFNTLLYRNIPDGKFSLRNLKEMKEKN